MRHQLAETERSQSWCEMNWCAVHTKPRQEEIAKHSLMRLGVEIFLPKLKQQKWIRRKRQMVISPLFPGYLFARFNTDIHFRAVNSGRGVRKVVTCGSTPAEVDEEMIESIKQRLEDGCVTLPTPSFTPGQTVRIQNGPLQGLEAVFEREMSDHQRAVLLLRALSYQPRVVIDLEHVVNA